jgi:TRAP transporter TAXI family solute receptor
MISVNDGKASFGTGTAESVKAAYDGTGEFDKKPQTRIRHVASFGFSLMFIYVRPDSPINSITELKGKTIVYGGGTGSLLLGTQILEAYGIAKDVLAQRGDTEKARAALDRKEIDAIFTVARLPVPAYSELAGRKAIKFLPIDPAPMKALQTSSPLYVDVDLKDFYPEYPVSTKAVGLPGPLVTRDDMDPGITYELLKIVYSNMTALQKMNDGFRKDSPATGLNGLAIPLHPGAERYFKEAGVLK